MEGRESIGEGKAGAGTHRFSTDTRTELINLINITATRRIRERVGSPWGDRNPETGPP